jgi:hypothetical protein
VTFLGLVRNHNVGRRVHYLEYEAFEPLAVKAFGRIAEEKRALARAALALHHRIGRLEIGEASGHCRRICASTRRARGLPLRHRAGQADRLIGNASFRGRRRLDRSTADPEDRNALASGAGGMRVTVRLRGSATSPGRRNWPVKCRRLDHRHGLANWPGNTRNWNTTSGRFLGQRRLRTNGPHVTATKWHFCRPSPGIITITAERSPSKPGSAYSASSAVKRVVVDKLNAVEQRTTSSCADRNE